MLLLSCVTDANVSSQLQKLLSIEYHHMCNVAHFCHRQGISCCQGSISKVYNPYLITVSRYSVMHLPNLLHLGQATEHHITSSSQYETIKNFKTINADILTV